MKQVLIIGIATGILATTVSGGVLAATPARDARQELDQLDNMRRQQAIQSEVERERERERASQQAAPVNETSGEAAKPAEAKFMISRITLLGDDNPSPKVTEILDARRDTLMGATEIMALVRDLTNYYAENGFVTTVVVVQPGKLNAGELTLEVKWGTIGGITVNGKEPGFRDRTRLFSAMPFSTGKRLNMSDVDQAVDNLVRGGGDDKIRIVAGELEGTSILDVTNTTQKMFSGSVGVNNNGRESDGWNQYFASVGVTNLLGLNDSLSAYYSQQDYNDTRNLQQIGSASFSMPLGYWTLDASWSGSHYENIVGGIFGDYLSTGTSSRYNFRASRVMHRDADGKTSAYVKFGTRNSYNDIEYTPVSVSTKKYSEFGIGVSHVGQALGGWAYGDLSISAGVPWMGAAWRDDPDLAAFDMNYTKVNGMLTWNRSFQLAGMDFEYELGSGFQYSEDSLVTDARYSLGDEYTVRGFKDTAFYGDSGAYLSNTLRVPLRFNIIGGINVTPFVGYDLGFIKTNGPQGGTDYVIGAAVGFRFSGKYFSSSLTYGWPIAAPAQPQPLAKALNYRLEARF